MIEEADKRSIKTWIEPFVGGGNAIECVPSRFSRLGYDANPHTIQALIGIRDHLCDMPDNVTEEDYASFMGTPPDPITSLVRFGCSFGGKFEGGFARGKDTYGYPRNYWLETLKGAQKQAHKIKNVQFACMDYSKLDCENCLVYCDPPYHNTTGYKTGEFNHDEFFSWCRKMAKNNLVFVSEYNAPDDFVEVWQGEQKTTLSSTRTAATHNAIEKLFLVRNNNE